MILSDIACVFTFVSCVAVCDGTLASKGEEIVTISIPNDLLVGLVVKASASRAEDPGFESRLRGDFSVVKSYQ